MIIGFYRLIQLIKTFNLAKMKKTCDNIFPLKLDS